MAETLPEGTDHVIPGAQNSTREKLKSDAADLRDKASAKAADIKGQAGDKAKEYAEEGKTRAAAGLDSVARMIGDSAETIDEKLGAAYGDYARRAGEAVSDFSASLREKEVEELIEDARDLVRRSPAIAIGAAAAAGFVLSRIIKAGSEALEETAQGIKTKESVEPKEGAETASAAARKAPAKRKPRTTT